MLRQPKKPAKLRGEKFVCNAHSSGCWCEKVNKLSREELWAICARAIRIVCVRVAWRGPARNIGRMKRSAPVPVKRCHWAKSPLMIEYHDREWGRPVHDDRRLFEFLILEGAQAGLSWETILKKRGNYRKAFDRFDPSKISCYDRRKVRELLANPGIVRNRLKIAATISNAQAFLAVRKEFGSFDRYVWQFVGGRPKKNNFKPSQRLPAFTSESDAMSKDRKTKRLSDLSARRFATLLCRRLEWSTTMHAIAPAAMASSNNTPTSTVCDVSSCACIGREPGVRLLTGI